MYVKIYTQVNVLSHLINFYFYFILFFFILRKPSTSAAVMPVPIDADRYNMNHKHRGKCIIFNHEEFDENVDKREGSTTDVKRLQKSFGRLGFDIEIHNDLSHLEIIDKIKKGKQSFLTLVETYPLFLIFDCIFTTTRININYMFT